MLVKNEYWVEPILGLVISMNKENRAANPEPPCRNPIMGYNMAIICQVFAVISNAEKIMDPIRKM